MPESVEGPVAVPPATEPEEHVRLEERTDDQYIISSQSIPAIDDSCSYEAVRRASAAIAEDRRPAAKDRVLLALNARRIRGAALSIAIAMLVRFNWAAGEMRHGGRLKLSNLTGYDIKGVDRGIEELVSKGVLIVRKGIQSDAGCWSSSTYVFPDMIIEVNGGDGASTTSRGAGTSTHRGEGATKMGVQTPPVGGGVRAPQTLEGTLEPTIEGHSPHPPGNAGGASERDGKKQSLIERLCSEHPDLAAVLRDFVKPIVGLRTFETSDPEFALVAIARHAAGFKPRERGAALNVLLRERHTTVGEAHVSKALEEARLAGGGQRTGDRPAAPYTQAHGMIEIRPSTHPEEWAAWTTYAYDRRRGDTLFGRMERLGVAHVPSVMPLETVAKGEAS